MALELCRCSAAELDFLARETVVAIVPRFRHPKLHFLSGNYGPFEPNVEERVPLWLAVTLKKRQRCRIRPPKWMQKGYLEDILERERTDGAFVAIDFHYQQIADILFKTARDNIDDADEVQALIEDLANYRQAKIRNGLKELAKASQSEMTWSVQLTHMSAMELFLVKDLLPEALNHFIDFSDVR